MNNNPRQLIATLREGAYAHPGEEEAIDIMLAGLEDIIPSANCLNILDVGCGLGGSARYIQQHKNHVLTGIDIDKNAIDYAKQHFPDTTFIQDDITQLSKHTFEKPFDVVYLLNVLYQFSDKNSVVRELGTVIKENGVLIISDYTTATEHELSDLAGRKMSPINLSSLEEILNKHGFNIVKQIDLTLHYEIWYRNTLQKLSSREATLLQTYTKPTFSTVHDVFQKILSAIQAKQLGGGIIYAIKTKEQR